MNVNNQPTSEVAGVTAFGSYEELAKSVTGHPKSVAAVVTQTFRGVPWEEALGLTARDAEKDATNATQAKTRMLTFGESLVPVWFLGVKADRIQVIYGWRICRPMSEDGKRLAALVGDRRIQGQVSMEPGLYRLDMGVSEQSDAFRKASAYVHPLAAIQTTLSEGSDLVKAAPSGGPDPTKRSAWYLMPVHPKVAGLFLHGPPIKDGINIYASMCGLVPPANQHLLDSMSLFMRMAATEGEDPGQSILSLQWEAVNPNESADLVQWYLALCALYALSPSQEEAPPPYRVGAGELAGGGLSGGTSAVAAPPEKAPYQRLYTQRELERLRSFCGTVDFHQEDGSDQGLTPFWHEFEKVRGKFHSARAHIEGWFDHHWPGDAPRYQRFISTALLKHMVTLDFDGQDAWFAYSKRHEGFSVYAVYPMPDHSDPGASRAKAQAYEDTMDNHRPGEREAMDSLSDCRSDTPANRTEMWKWVQYYMAATETIFGPEAPILPYLQRMKELLGQETMFRGHGSVDWRAYFWKYHMALRAYYSPSGGLEARLQPMIDLLGRMRQGIPVSRTEVPEEALAVKGKDRERPIELRSAPSNQRREDSGSAGNRDSNVAKRLAKEWSRQVAESVKDAADAVKAVGKEWSMKVLYPKGVGEAFGDMTSVMRANSAGRKDPCPRLFTYGQCKVKKCNQSHSMDREPSGGQSKRFVDWVKGRCSAIKTSPGNA